MQKHKIRFFWLGFISIFVMIFLAACQPTPDNTIIVGKDGIDTEEVETQEPDFMEGNNIVTPEPSGTETNIWKDYYLDKHGIFEVNINAEVEIPNTNKFPVIRIKPIAFLDEHLKKVVDVFFGDTTVYNGDSPLTKEEIAQAIVQIKAQIKEAEESGWSGAIYSDDYIAQLEEEYENAPTVTELEETEVSWILDDDGKGQINIIADSNNGSFNRITGVSSDSGSYIEFHKDLSNYQITGALNSQPKGVNITEKEAADLAEQSIKKLGLNEFQLNGEFIGSQFLTNSNIGANSRQDNFNYENQCYVFCFTRTIDEIPITYVHMASGDTDSENTQYAPSIPKEYIEYYINDSGIIGFKWSNAFEVVEYVSDNVKLLDFKEIQEIFLKQMKIIGEGRNQLYNSGTKNVTSDLINVTKVTLGMMVIVDKDRSSTFRVIPVWDFFVTLHKEYSDGTSQNGWNPAGNDAAYSILTLNAYDGSIINRNLGY